MSKLSTTDAHVFNFHPDEISFSGSNYNPRSARQAFEKGKNYIRNNRPNIVLLNFNTGANIRPRDFNCKEVRELHIYDIRDHIDFARFCAYNSFQRSEGFKNDDPNWFKVNKMKCTIIDKKYWDQVQHENPDVWKEGWSKFLTYNTQEQVKTRVHKFLNENFNFNLPVITSVNNTPVSAGASKTPEGDSVSQISISDDDDEDEEEVEFSMDNISTVKDCNFSYKDGEPIHKNSFEKILLIIENHNKPEGWESVEKKVGKYPEIYKYQEGRD